MPEKGSVGTRLPGGFGAIPERGEKMRLGVLAETTQGKGVADVHTGVGDKWM